MKDRSEEIFTLLSRSIPELLILRAIRFSLNQRSPFFSIHPQTL